MPWKLSSQAPPMEGEQAAHINQSPTMVDEWAALDFPPEAENQWLLPSADTL